MDNIKTPFGASLEDCYANVEARRKAISGWLVKYVVVTWVSIGRITALRQRMVDLEDYAMDLASDLGDAEAERRNDEAWERVHNAGLIVCLAPTQT